MGGCALGTWVYRVAHNTATSICIRRRRQDPQLLSIEDLDLAGPEPERERAVDERRALDQLLELIHRLRPFELFPESENRFFAKVGGIEIWFDRDAQGRSAALNIRQGGGTRQLKRVE